MSIDNLGEQGDYPAWELVPRNFSPDQRKLIEKRIAQAAYRYPPDVPNDVRRIYIEHDTTAAVEALLEAEAMKDYMTGNT